MPTGSKTTSTTGILLSPVIVRELVHTGGKKKGEERIGYAYLGWGSRLNHKDLACILLRVVTRVGWGISKSYPFSEGGVAQGFFFWTFIVRNYFARRPSRSWFCTA